MIHIRTITLELSQTLPSGEEQTLIVEVTGQDEQIITADPAWTNGIVGLSDIIGTATSCLSHAKLRIASIEEGLI